MIINSQEEEQILKEGGQILAKILSKLAQHVQIGNTPEQVEQLARKLMQSYGVKPATLGYKPKFAKIAYPAATCVSVNDAIVHGVPVGNNRQFQDGDLVAIDVVIQHRNLFVDSAVTVGVGNLSKQDQALLEANQKALYDAIAVVKAGIRVGEIGKKIAQVSKQTGFKLPKELGGHGVGKAIHERPFIANYDGAPDSDYILKEGEVITIEPMMSAGSAKLDTLPDGYTIVVQDGSKTSHFEHTLIVRKDGAEIITQL